MILDRHLAPRSARRNPWPRLLLAGIALVLASVSCAPQITPERALQTAHAYAELKWTPGPGNVRHGPDRDGIQVHTPDVGLAAHGDDRGWWRPGTTARGMPYQWGGFDTPSSFLRGVRRGRKAGDIATLDKVEQGRAAVSRESVGVDCSGFVSRCWGLRRHVSTREMPEICDPLDSWDELLPGDALLKPGHVILFRERSACGTFAIGYEAGPKPHWRVQACGISWAELERQGFTPWRYRGMRHG